ncbi:hypothetical protein SAMN04487866_12816 [Thermoactinomyces sp. DSM 45891]|uniref:hypothetical protein n=1 Tax=Thermoactinomyces sp. DSM 45891 TaxID=1761907 RepID=UPI000913B5F7|nr:hypothetical protein [Thermoactinomyces sp. DSM 45891]SFX80917.1 hypothetical protein SAMN04487866_12816 [Thermoactinomyces sp. DSM 45891]
MLLPIDYVFYSFLRSPRKVGSIIPSSQFLAQEMLKNVPWEQMKTIVELGAGTGVFTEHMARSKPSTCQMIVFEQDMELREV